MIFNKLGYLIISKKAIKNNPMYDLSKKHNLEEAEIIFITANTNGGLRDKLIEERKTRWLDIGCGGTFEDNFIYIDLFPETIVNKKDKYFRIDVINATDSELNKLGKFDLIRMQHVFEHFTPEDGRKVLNNCSKLLEKDGYILITTPNLKMYVHLYLSGKIREKFEWAHKRIEEDSPNSFYFSIFSHSMLFEKHKWCYDAEGIIYQFEFTHKFKNIREVKLNDEYANIPFTHNRPDEDVCVVAQLR